MSHITLTNAVVSVAGKSGNVSLVKGDVGLGNVDNTSDVNKPVSTAQAAAIAAQTGTFAPANVTTVTMPAPSGGDDTAAIDAVFAAYSSTIAMFEFRRGTYNYSGTGFGGYYPYLRGQGVGSTTINLGSTSSMVNVSHLVNAVDIRGFTFSGGQDVIKLGWTGTNVTLKKIVRENYFVGYTGCAIQSNASDDPLWQITGNYFYGANYTTCMGVALSGLTDQDLITGNSFARNRVHIKLREGGNNAKLRDNDFLRFGATSGSPRIDVWIVPRASQNNAGIGFSARDNKFGNENLDAADYRIVYADEDTGTGSNNGTYWPNLAADSSGWIIGHDITDNQMNGAANAPMPLVYSTTPNVKALRVAGQIGGSKPTYVIQYRTPPGADRATQDSVFGPFVSNEVGTEASVPFPNSNAGGSVGSLIDPTGSFNGRVGHPHAFPLPDPVDYVPLLVDNITSYGLGTGASRSAITDGYGGSDAAELTFASVSPLAFTYKALTGTLLAGVPVWIEWDQAPGTSSPLTSLRVAVLYGTLGTIHWRRMVPVQTGSGWTRQRFQFTPRENTTAIDIALGTDGVQTGSVKLGRVRVYHSRSPQNVDGRVINFNVSGAISAGGRSLDESGLFGGRSLSTGEETVDRRLVNASNLPLASGQVQFTYFTARKTETISQIKMFSGTTAMVTPTHAFVGVYSLDASYAATLVAQTADDATLFAATSTGYTRSFVSSFTKTAGVVYAIGVLVTAATPATILGNNAMNGAQATELQQTPRMSGRGAATGLTALPSSVTNVNISSSLGIHYAVLLP